MLTTSDLLAMNNEELYEVYSVAVKNRELPTINVIRNIVADRFTIKELKKSPLDEPFKNPDISKFFNVK